MHRSWQFSLTAAILVGVASPATAEEIGTAMTVQGIFSDEGVPIGGDVDVIVSLFDAAADGNEVAPAVRVDAVTAVDGLITLTVDFGADAFDGEARFLEFQIRNPHDPDDIAPFVLLEGRIPITPTPETVHAQKADTAETVAAPLSLTLDDANTPTLRVENVAAEGVGLEVQGDLTVGPAGEVHVDADTGNVDMQGTLTASGAAISGSAAVGGDFDVGGGAVISGVTFLESRLDMGGNAIDSIGSLGSSFGATGGLALEDTLTVGTGGGLARIDGATGDVSTLGSATLGDDALDDTIRVNGRFEVAPDPGSDPKTFIQGTDGFMFIGDSLELEGAFIDSAGDSPGEPGQVLSSTGDGTAWRNPGDIEGNFRVNGNFLVGGDSEFRGGVAVQALDATPIFTVERDVVQRVTTHKELKIDASLLDAVGSPGTDDQVLRTTGTGVEWTRLVVNDLDVDRHAITNIGTSGSQFDASGDLEVRGELRVGAAGDPRIFLRSNGEALFDGLVGVTEGLSVSTDPDDVKFTVDGADGSFQAGPFADPTFTVNGATGDVIVKGAVGIEQSLAVSADPEDIKFGVDGTTGDIFVRGAYFDSSVVPDPGTPGQILSSTAVGTDWIDRNAFVDGIAVPDEENAKFAVATTGDTNIDAPLTVRVTTGGNPNPGETVASSSVVDFGIAVEGVALQSGFGVSAAGIGAGNAGVSTLGLGGATGLDVGASGGGAAIGVQGEGRIGDMTGNSDDPQGALKVENLGTGHTLVVAGGDGIHVEKAYFDSTPDSGTPGQILSSTGVGTDWIDVPGIGGDAEFERVQINQSLKLGTDPANPTVEIDATTGNAEVCGGLTVKEDTVTRRISSTCDDVNSDLPCWDLDYDGTGDALSVDTDADGLDIDCHGDATNLALDVDCDTGATAIRATCSDPNSTAPCTSWRSLSSGSFSIGAYQNTQSTAPVYQWDLDHAGSYADIRYNNTTSSADMYRIATGHQGNVYDVDYLNTSGTGHVWDFDYSGSSSAVKIVARAPGSTGVEVTTADSADHALATNGTVKVSGGICDGQDSTGSTGQVATADGIGGWSWVDPAGGGGPNATFDTVHVQQVASWGVNQETITVTVDASTGDLVTVGSVDAEGGIDAGFNSSSFLGKTTVAHGVNISGSTGRALSVFAGNNTVPSVEIDGPPGGAPRLKVHGDTEVTGNLSKGGGSFKIDHPLDPEHKYLYHSFVESPDMMNIYNGNVVTDHAGYATVVMPEWFDALNRDFRYQLTVIDGADAEEWVFAKVARELEGNDFVIRTSQPYTKVSWQVTGVRQDAWANTHRIPVEEDKPAGEVGTYLHPLELGMPEDLGISQQSELRMRAEQDRARRPRDSGAS